MKKFRCTKRSVDAVPLPARGKTIINDTEEAGFSLAIYPTGKHPALGIEVSKGKDPVAEKQAAAER